MAELLAPKPGTSRDTAAAAKRVRETCQEIRGAQEKFGDILGGMAELDMEDAAASSRPSAMLDPKGNSKKSIPRRVCFTELPGIVATLRPLWDVNVWSEGDVELGNAVAEFLTFVEGPKPAFVKGTDAKNRESLETIVSWYREQIRTPLAYASMILTMDDGPWAGLPYEAANPLPNAVVQKLDTDTELRWAKVDRAVEPWVVQCVHKGRPLWARVVSSEPNPSVKSVAVSENSVKSLGPYGWRVTFHVEWGFGFEGAHLYIAADRTFLFYFMSW